MAPWSSRTRRPRCSRRCPGSISPSLVDETADLDSIADVVSSLLAAGGAAPKGRDGRDFASLLDRIRERSGIDFSTYKTATIVRRLRGRMGATKVASLAEYADLVEHDPEEYARLVSSLLIKVTEFFRDPKVFEYLRDDTLPALIDEALADGRQLRVWSAGCSTGEEAYSLAITLAEALGTDRAAFDVRVFATDIDSSAIAFARRGVYPASALQKVPAAIRERYFAKTDGGYEVVKSLRSLMTFGEHDLGARAPFPRIDLILCRNVLIYFTVPMQRAALETFGFSLRDGGRLVLGPSETVAAMPGLYDEDHGRLRVYRRVQGGPPLPLARALPARPPQERARQLDAADPLDPPGRPGRGRLERSCREAAARPEPRGRRRGRSLLHHPDQHGGSPDAGDPRTGVRPGLHPSRGVPAVDRRSGPRSMRRSAGRPRRPCTRSTRRMSPRRRPISSRRSIRPNGGKAGPVDGAVIELTDVSRAERDRQTSAEVERRLDRAALVNRRLQGANEELTALVAELRNTNQSMLQASEEAQSGREEVETLNEEFQATNEELETLNEELTASVEELRIANEDLGARTEQLRLQSVALEEQKQTREEEHNRLESVLASLGDAVVAVDHAGRTVATNPTYDRLFGGPEAKIRPEDLAGLPMPKADWPQQRAARGERFRMEFALSDPDGSRRWFEAVTEPLTSEDRTWGGVIAIRDVSERTMRLSLERLMAAAGHELKTPTAALHNYLQLVDRHLADGQVDQAATYATRALAQTRRLATLIERLLDVSRIQSGQLELHLDVVDLTAVVRSAVEVAQVLPKAPPIRVKVGVDPVTVRGDAGRLEQVFLNLLANAMEHAPGSKTIDVTIGSSDGRAEVAVRDRGPGVSADGIRTMFDAYTRLGDPHQTPGLGLGLYVAREIVTAHEGEIEARSRVGKGTVVTVRLPVAERRSARGRARGRRAG